MGRDATGDASDVGGGRHGRSRFAGELDEVVVITPTQQVDEFLVKLGLAGGDG